MIFLILIVSYLVVSLKFPDVAHYFFPKTMLISIQFSGVAVSNWGLILYPVSFPINIKNISSCHPGEGESIFPQWKCGNPGSRISPGIGSESSIIFLPILTASLTHLVWVSKHMHNNKIKIEIMVIQFLIHPFTQFLPVQVPRGTVFPIYFSHAWLPTQFGQFWITHTHTRVIL